MKHGIVKHVVIMAIVTALTWTVSPVVAQTGNRANDNLPPDPFSLLLPADHDSVTETIAFDWQDASDLDGDVVRYLLNVSKLSSFPVESTTVYGPLSQSSYFSTGPDLPKATYHWKVVAYDDSGAYRESDQTWSFFFEQCTRCGDANGDYTYDISDVVFLIEYIFMPGSPAPGPCRAPDGLGDANGDRMVDISDAVFMLCYFPGCIPPHCP